MTTIDALLGLTVGDSRALTVLDFDCECRPLAWYGGDFVTKQPTAISWKIVGANTDPEVAVIGLSNRMTKVLDEERDMLEAFRVAYNAADVVTGHYIRGFDLPLLNGAAIRLGLPMFGDKFSQDTKNDFARAHGMSKSMENLGAMFELEHPKIPMNTALWAAANMLLPEGIAHCKERVVGDVVEHIEMRSVMLERGLLAAPQMWTASSSGGGRQYAP